MNFTKRETRKGAMNELINITVNDNHEPVVSGRDLHKVLEIKTQYTKWLERIWFR